MDRTGTVLIHCGLGYARTAVVTAALLLDRRLATSVDDACRMVLAVRPRARFSHDAKQLLACLRSLEHRPSCDRSSAPARP
ncbi:MAG: dual specificity protein phosphatase family protein [Phycisphaerales bacterium]|nr:dual specificity protein phosphatase family protein [Phycisphaerales bacterium]